MVTSLYLPLQEHTRSEPAGRMPKVMSSFVLGASIHQIYLPLIGDNMAKQMGVLGAGKRWCDPWDAIGLT